MSVTKLPAVCYAFRCLAIRSPVSLSRSAGLHTSVVSCIPDKPRDRRDLTRNVPKAIEGVEGQYALDIDVAKEHTKCYRLPDENTPNELFNGIPFCEVPICLIKCSKNNTIMHLQDAATRRISITRSCGTEGFKHCRKGTTVAAHTTGVAMAGRLTKAGLTTVRVCIKGLGPGRMESVKGLLVGGINIISISDVTRYYDFPSRPPAARSI